MTTFRLAAVAVTLLSCNPKSPEPRPAPQSADVHAEAAEDATPAHAADPTTSEGPTFTVYDLLANRPLAHGIQGPMIAVTADGGSRSFMRNIQGNHSNWWDVAVDVEGRAATRKRRGRATAFWMPAVQGVASDLEAQVYSPKKAKVAVTVNGTRLNPLDLERGWQDAVISIPVEAARAENEIVLDLGAGGAIGKVRSERNGLGVALDDARDVAAEQGPLDVSLTLGGAIWHVWPLEGARLKVVATGPEDCAVQAVWARGRTDGALEMLGHKDVVVGTTWIDFGDVHDVVRVAIAPQERTCPEGLTITDADLVVPGDRPKVPQGKPPKHILFWMIDTLRSDHLPIHFDTDVQAPNLVRLANEGASFPLAYVQGNESKVSHASLFAGLYPSKHGIKRKGTLKPAHHLITEALQDNGYKTYGFIANGYVSGNWGFEQGWSMYRNNLREGFAFKGDDLAEDALTWMQKRPDERMFMYVGTIDPHVTYREHEEFIGLYDEAKYSGRFRRSLSGGDLGQIAQGKLTVTEREKKRIIALYKNEITFNDKAFGQLRAGLEALGTWDDTMVIVTGDHGDQFWEHGGVGHGGGVHQELVHVPLIITYPPLIPAGSTPQAGADVVDIYSTILDAIDASDVPPDPQGHSLLELIHGVRGDYPEPAIATHYLARYGIQMQHWKMIVKNGAYELFDRKADPNETINVAGQRPLAERWLVDAFSIFRPHRSSWKKSELGPPSNLRPGFLEHAHE